MAGNEKTTLELRLDKQLKQQAAAVCQARGTSVSAEVQRFLQRLVRREQKRELVAAPKARQAFTGRRARR